MILQICLLAEEEKPPVSNEINNANDKKNINLSAYFQIAYGKIFYFPASQYRDEGLLLYGGNDKEYINKEKDGFYLKKLRLALDGKIDNNFSYEIDLELSGENNELETKDVYLLFSPLESGLLKAYLGQFKVPFSRSYNISSKKQILTKRSALADDDFIPGRDRGIMGEFELSFMSFSAGMFSGTGTGTTDGNPKGSYLYASRMEFFPFGNINGEGGVLFQTSSFVLPPFGGVGGDFHFVIGANAAYSDDYNKTLAFNKYSYSYTGKKLLYGADLSVSFAGLFLTAEYIIAKISPDDSDEEKFNAGGYFVRGSYYISFLSLELAAMYERIDTNDDVDENPREDLISGGINYYYSKKIKAQIDYNYPLKGDYQGNLKSWMEPGIIFLVQVEI